MAKKGPRQIAGLKCTICNKFGYITERNRTNTPEKLGLMKFCKNCLKHTPHKEVSKLK